MTSGFPWPALLFLSLYNSLDVFFIIFSTLFSSWLLGLFSTSAYKLTHTLAKPFMIHSKSQTHTCTINFWNCSSSRIQTAPSRSFLVRASSIRSLSSFSLWISSISCCNLVFWACKSSSKSREVRGCLEATEAARCGDMGACFHLRDRRSTELRWKATPLERRYNGIELSLSLRFNCKWKEKINSWFY